MNTYYIVILCTYKWKYNMKVKRSLKKNRPLLCRYVSTHLCMHICKIHMYVICMMCTHIYVSSVNLTHQLSSFLACPCGILSTGEQGGLCFQWRDRGSHLRREGRGSKWELAITCARHAYVIMCCAHTHICSPKVVISHRTTPNDHLRTR